MRFQIGAMTAGDILDRGLKLLVNRLPIFFLITFIVQLPALFYNVGLPFLAERNAVASAFGGLLGMLLAAIILGPIGTAVILYVIWQEFVERRVGVAEAFHVALARFGSILWGSVAYGLILIVGVCMCGIGYFVFLSWFALFSQVIVVEGLGAFPALERSKELTEGYRLRLLGILFLFQIIGLFLVVALNIVLGVLLPLEYVYVPPFPAQPVFSTNLVLHQLFLYPVSVLVAAYASVCMTLLYFDLRIRKEGFDLEVAAHKASRDGSASLE